MVFPTDYNKKSKLMHMRCTTASV